MGEGASFVTNLNNGWQQIDVGWELHFGTNMNINLLSGLTNGTYELEVFALAGIGAPRQGYSPACTRR